MDQMVMKGVEEGTTHEVRRRLAEEAGWIQRLRPDLNVRQEMGELTVPGMEVKEGISMEEGGDVDEIRARRNEDYRRLGLNELTTMHPMMAG
jgi:hypothetical protein